MLYGAVNACLTRASADHLVFSSCQAGYELQLLAARRQLHWCWRAWGGCGLAHYGDNDSEPKHHRVWLPVGTLIDGHICLTVCFIPFCTSQARTSRAFLCLCSYLCFHNSSFGTACNQSFLQTRRLGAVGWWLKVLHFVNHPANVYLLRAGGGGLGGGWRSLANLVVADLVDEDWLLNARAKPMSSSIAGARRPNRLPSP